MNIENYLEQRRKTKPGEIIFSDQHECGFCGNKDIEYIGRIAANSERHYLSCVKCGKQIRLSTEEIFEFFKVEVEDFIKICREKETNWKTIIQKSVCSIVNEQKAEQEKALSSKKEETQEIPVADIQKALRESARIERIRKFHEERCSKRYLKNKNKKMKGVL